MNVHQRLEAVTDLSHLSPASDDLIVACLRERFMTDNIYTSIGTSGLVALNPHKYVASNSDSVLHKYAAEYRDASEHKQPLPPHIFQLANNAYYHMRRTTQDQTIVFRGETGSGKSENRRLAIKALLELSVSNPGKKGSKLATQVPASEFVLETFGNARTLFNPNASRFGKYTELQFSERGRLCGVKTLDYYLERNRISGAPSGERNFHIFYYLVAGASPEERQHLHLVDRTAYRFLGQRNATGRLNGGRDDDALRFEQLKVALKTIGLSKRHVAQTCQLIAAILHLGNLEFTIDRSRNEDAAVVRNTDLLNVVAEFLGVLPSALESALSYKTKLMKKELCTVFLDPDGASDNRDDLAKNLYSLLFAWLNEHINQRLCKDDFSTFIGLFDLPGPQNMTSRANSLDQFCVNFANERLQGWTQKRLFESHVAEYNSEGISRLVPQVSYLDNAECVRLLQHRPGGVIHIMDDQARRAPRKTDQTMVEAFQKRWGNHSSFKTGSSDRNGNLTFTVHHFNGPITYSSENFLARNLDALNPDFVSLLRGTDGQEGSGSMNPFVKGLFSAKAIATQAHPRNEDTIVAAQQAVKPIRAPSTRRKHTIKRLPTLREGGDGADEKEEAEEVSPGGTPCVAGQFKAALDTLFETLDEAQAWFVFCINPNDSQLPNQLEGRSVKGQVRSVGLVEVAKRSINVFEVGMTPEEFCERYSAGLEAAHLSEGEALDKIQQARTTFGLTERDLVVGQHKVFLSHLAFHTFEDQVRSHDVEEQKRNRLRDAEADAGLNSRGINDPYAPYLTPGMEPGEVSPVPWGGYNEQDNVSNQALPLVNNASPFQRADIYDEYEENKSLRSEDFDGRSPFTSQRDHDDSMTNYGSESYAPSRNMFHNENKKTLLADKEILPGEIQDGETTEVLKESSARRKWVALCWILTFWIPSPFLSWIGRMKRMDVRQAWREKLAINILIWLACACAIFVIGFLNLLICPTEHVFNINELASHSSTLSPNNVMTAIRGEVFDLTTIAAQHQRVIGVIPSSAILKYGGQIADNLFPVQVSALCNGVDGNVSPYVILDSRNVSDPNAVYHDFRAFTNDSRPDWYFESMVRMRYAARRGFVGYTPKEIRNMANQGRSVGIYNGLIYDVTNYITSPPAVRAPYGMQAPPTNTQFMDSSVLDVFKFNAGKDITKQLDGLTIDPVVLARQKICLRNLFTIGQVDNRNSTQCQFSTYLLLSLSIIMITVIGFKFLASINFAAPRAPEDHDKFVICQVPCYTEGDASLRKTIDSLAQLKYDDKRKLLLIICDGMIVGSGNDRPTPRIVLDILGADPNLDPEPLSFLSLGEGAKQHNMGKVYSGLYECAGHVVPYLVIAKVGKPTERARPGNRGKRDSQMLIMRFLNKVHFNTPMSPLELEMYHQIKNVIGVNPTFYEYLFMIDADTTVDPFSVNRLISAMIHDKKLLGVCGETELANAKQSLITMMQVYEYFISHHMAKAFESLFGSVTCLPGCFTLYRLRTPDTHKPLLISNQIIEDYSENRISHDATLLLKHFPLFKTQFVRDAHAYTVAPDDWKVLLSQRRRWINSTVHNLGELVFLEQLCGFCCFSMRFIVMIDLLSTLTQPVTVLYIAYLIYQVVGQDKPIPKLALILIGAIYGLQAAVFDEGKFDPRSIPLKAWTDYENELWDKESNHSIGSWVPPAKAKGEGYAESHTASIYGRETYYDPRSYSPAPSQVGMHPPPGYNSGRNTPQSNLRMGETGSLLHQPAPSRPVTNYLDMPMPLTGSPDNFNMPGSPTDVDIDRAVQDILRGADLNTVTKREIRRQLEEVFGMDLTRRKATINAAIDKALLGQV
ncbi:Chitin synthase 8 [Termitomyces sp. J132]|nr:Chitin synthase 8 [Termitomyces sp. J132]